MTSIEALEIKYLLETLDGVGAGMTLRPLMDQVERMIQRTITTVERKKLIQLAEKREWVYTFRSEITEEVIYAISDRGRTAMVGL